MFSKLNFVKGMTDSTCHNPFANMRSLISDPTILPKTEYAERKLENGLHLICHADPSSPIVTLDLIYHVGSRFEEPGKTGYAHLLEHLMFDGSPHLKRGEYDRYCTMVGGENNAWTSSDLTNYWIALPTEHLELGLWLESDRMEGFGVTQESLETQKKVVIAEKRQVIDNVPYGNAGSVIRELMFASGHPYRHEPIGAIEDIRQARLDDLRHFFDRYYVPENAVLVIAGNLTAEETLDRTEEYFGDIERTSSRENFITPSPDSKRTGKRQRVVDPITPLNATFVGWHVPGSESHDLYALELLGIILGSGDSSRFRLALEYDPLIASEASAFIDEGELGSIFCAYAVAQNNRISPHQLEESILCEIRRVTIEGITERELTKVKNRKTTSIAQSLLSISERAERIARHTALFNDPSLAWNEADLYEQITVDDIISVAENYLCAVEPVVVEFIELKS